ncbi:hypothetical protein HPB51_018765 [Rhipicephalus microplus]|uniref:Uncharacterized protein n=1 Tax=Rhipicephalus microplus TaxID=6941 RepID=A0A9J6DI68_RHIMP|nr:hypothetical protein HPB51_018765 [Rhipicephalus microplus]
MLFSLLGAVSSMLPYLVYGPGKHLEGDVRMVSGVSTSTTQFCGTSDVDAAAASCQAIKEDAASIGPLMFFFMGNFLNGLGGTAYYVIGTTYMDDNVKKKNSAVYFGMSAILLSLLLRSTTSIEKSVITRGIGVGDSSGKASAVSVRS